MESESRGAIAIWLRVRRRESGLTQAAARAEYARRSGKEVSSGTWSRWENGAQAIGEESLPALEAMFGPAPLPPMPPDYRRQMRADLAEQLRPIEDLLREIVQELRRQAPRSNGGEA